ncbi:MAG TPA: alpha/beta hydrolase [Gaiellaceae bacterium]|nr:alpha/beta hydrolase [Gaiellaceae bacterium]
MPVGYLITTGGIAAAALSAVARHRPRRASPFRVSYLFGLWLNWPLIAFLLLAASTALAIAQSGIDSVGVWIGLGLALVASAALVVLGRRAHATGPVLERALDDGLGADWRDGVEASLSTRLSRRPSLTRIVLTPFWPGRRGVERIANVRYGPARRSNLLDVYRERSGRSDAPVLVHFHPLFGSKRVGTRHLFHRLAARGWVCVAANYRRSSDHDVANVVAWVREHGSEHGADPATIFLAGSSLGAHLASQAAFADTAVAGVICLYGYYGGAARTATPHAPPCFVVHGDQDSLVPVDDARGFVEQLRATSSNAVVYAELPGAQHGFDLFRSRRFDTVVDGIEAFTSYVRHDRDIASR